MGCCLFREEAGCYLFLAAVECYPDQVEAGCFPVRVLEAAVSERLMHLEVQVVQLLLAAEEEAGVLCLAVVEYCPLQALAGHREQESEG